MQITIIPLGTATPSVGEYVADVIRFLKDRGIPHTLTDMGTTIEGESEELLRLAARIHGLSFHRGAERVVTQIVLDERRDRQVHLSDKYQSVLRQIKDA